MTLNSDAFERFSRHNHHLDAFYFRLIGTKREFADLWSVMKCVFVLFHGNASVESGFSINNEILVENLHEESVVAQRQVYDAVHDAGGIACVDVNKAMLQFVRGAHSRYEQCLALKRRDTAENVRKAADRNGGVIKS